MKKLFTFWSMALMVLALGFSQKAQAQTWIVAGEPAEAFHGSYWNPADTQNQMVLQDDGTYKYESFGFKVEQSNIKFKVTNGSWNESYPGDNYIINVDGKGIYDLVVTFNPETKEVNGTATKKESIESDDVYMVKGSSIVLFGAEWGAADDEANTLIKQDDGTFVKTYENVTLPEGTILYKFIKNNDWDEMNGPNRELTIEKSGIYNVTFKVTPKGNEDGSDKGEAFTELIESTVVEDVYVVKGSSEVIFGALWEHAEDAPNTLTKQDDGTYAKTYENLELTAGTILYKFIKNGNWNELNPSDRELVIEKPGIYTITFTVNPALGDGDHSILKTGDIVIDIPALYIIGEANDNGWFANVGLAMTKTGDATFEAEEVTFKGANEGYSYFGFAKQLMNDADDWDNLAQYRIGAVAEGAFLVTDEYLDTELALAAGQVSFQIPAGIYTLKADLAAMKLVITKTGEYGDNPNAIEQVENSATATVWYNLQGQRVAAPVKGVYIHNGRKVVVK